jgi:hypothetical protein
MNKTQKTIYFIVGGLILACLIFSLGFYAGKIKGKKMVDLELKEKADSYKKIAETAYPEPPKEIFEIGGTVKEKGKNFLVITTIDPEDYMPHPDGSPYRTLDIKVNVGENTLLKFFDYSKLDANGNPIISQISIENIKLGERVLVKSKVNIKNAVEFTASEIITSKL